MSVLKTGWMIDFVAKKVAKKLLCGLLLLLISCICPLFSSKNVLVRYNNPVSELLRSRALGQRGPSFPGSQLVFSSPRNC